MVGITLPHDDAAQVGVAGKADTHHVPDLALVPIGGRPNVADGARGRFIVADGDRLETQVQIVRERVKLVDQLVARLLLEMVNARNVEKQVEGEFVAAEFANLMQGFGREHKGLFAAEFGAVLDRVTEARADRVADLRVCHFRSKRAVPFSAQGRTTRP
jgi:hypothetical protein